MGLGPASIHTFKHETSRPIKIKFHLEHHWGWGLAALGLGPDRIRTLVSMATDSSHMISTVILLPSADLFKKGCCQLQAKVCARIIG